MIWPHDSRPPIPPLLPRIELRPVPAAAITVTAAHEVLGRSLDELPPQSRRVLAAVIALVGEGAASSDLRRSEARFTRKDVRAASGWGDTQLKLHLGRLVELEYLLVHRAERDPLEKD